MENALREGAFFLSVAGLRRGDDIRIPPSPLNKNTFLLERVFVSHYFAIAFLMNSTKSTFNCSSDGLLPIQRWKYAQRIKETFRQYFGMS
jgi:hypothetical protein